jgi:hypothetical protein
MRSPLTILLLVIGCGSAPAPAPTSLDNSGGQPPPRADASLAGPYAELTDAESLQRSPDSELTISELAIAESTDGIEVSLQLARTSWAAASCFVVVRTPSGYYVGDGFLCDASRSDEEVTTDQMSVTVEGAVATIRFRTSYTLIGSAPDVDTYQITCDLGTPLSCTPPPAIGGYGD